MADYPYIFGLFKSLESKLLNANDIERMVDAPDAGVAFRVFNDTAFADNLLEVKPEEFNKALDDDLKQTHAIFRQEIADRKILEFIFSRYDFHNIKLCFKAKYSGQNLKKNESEVGTVSRELIRNYIIAGQKPDLPKHIKTVIDQALNDFEKNKDPNHIDAFLDQAMFSHLKRVAGQLNNKFISDFLKRQIDLSNVKIFLRAKRLKKEAKWLAKELISGGQVPTKEMLGVYDKELKIALDTCCAYFDNRFRPIIEEYLKNQNLWWLEQAFENYELDFLKEAKRLAYGPEIAVAYFYANKNALRQVRLIMTGKLNGVPPAEIRERLRNLW